MFTVLEVQPNGKYQLVLDSLDQSYGLEVYRTG